MRSDLWRGVRTDDGSWTLAHPSHGETCHSTAGAWLEARERYAVPCRLRTAAMDRRGGVVKLLDIGTGLGVNLAAALEAVSGAGATLYAVSFERDLAVVDCALRLYGCEAIAASCPEMEPWHRDVRDALRRSWNTSCSDRLDVPLGSRGALRVIYGDARDTLPALQMEDFDAVFLDPFSPRVEPELWDPSFLCAVASKMAPQGWLSTFSSAISVRVALRAAGLRVGPGPRVGHKREGTVASPQGLPPPLDARTSRRLARRSAELQGQSAVTNPLAPGGLEQS